MASVCPVLLRRRGGFVFEVVPPEGNGNKFGEKNGHFGVRASRKPSAFEIQTCTQVFGDEKFFLQLFGLN